LDLRQLHVAVPQHRGIFGHQVGAQHIVTIPQLSFLQLGLVELKDEGLPRHLLSRRGQVDVHESESPSHVRFRAADTHQQLIPLRTTAPHRAQLPQQPCEFLPPDCNLLGSSLLASTYNSPSCPNSFTSTHARISCQANASHFFSAA
jgi:hypothetical protein